MTSIVTNISAKNALQTLNAVNENLKQTQQQASTGLEISKAADGVAYWSISTTMKSDNKALSSVSDAINLTSAVMDTTYSALEAIHSEYDSIKALMVTAQSMPTPETSYPYNAYDNWEQMDPTYAASDQAKVAQAIDQHMQQIRGIFESASFNGLNLLYMGDNSPIEAKTVTNTFVTGFSNGKVQTMDLPLTDTLLVNDSLMDAATFSNMNPGNGGLLDSSFSLLVTGSNGVSHATGIAMYTNWSVSASGGQTQAIERSNDMVRKIEFYTQRYGGDREDAWNQLINQWDNRVQALTDLMAKVGSIQQATDMHSASVSTLRNKVDEGVSGLIDADMEATSARLAALQTQSQLATQSLQIANSSASSLITLFQ